MRWIHIASVVTLIGGFIYARFVLAPALASLAPAERNGLTAAVQSTFRPLLFTVIATALISGMYNYATKASYPPGYHMWMGIKLLFVFHITSSAIVDSVRRRIQRKATALRLGIAISGINHNRDCRLLEVFVSDDRIRSTPESRGLARSLRSRQNQTHRRGSRAPAARDDHESYPAAYAGLGLLRVFPER